jgi:hypothetical protein
VNLGKYSKFWVAVIGLAITTAAVAFGSTNHWVVEITAAASALGVYAIPNAGYVEAKFVEHVAQGNNTNGGESKTAYL